MIHIKELTFVITGLSLNQYKELINDFKKTNISYQEIGYIDNVGLITLNEKFMPKVDECINYIDSLNYLLNKWKDYEPYFDEGGIQN